MRNTTTPLTFAGSTSTRILTPPSSSFARLNSASYSSSSGAFISFARRTLASSLFRDEGDMPQQVVADATGGVMTLGTGVCVSGDVACEGKRKESRRIFVGGLVGGRQDGQEIEERR